MPHRRHVRVRQQRVHVLEPREQRLGRVEDRRRPASAPRHPPEHRPAQPRHPPADAARSAPSTSGRLGQREQPQRLAGRRRVDHDHVVLALVVVVADPQQVAELVHAGQHGHLLGHDLVEAAPANRLDEVRLDRAPVARDVEEDVGLLGPQVRRDLARRRAERACRSASARLCAMSVETTMRAQAALGAQHRGRRRDARLADAALAGVQQDASHGPILERKRRLGPAARPDPALRAQQRPKADCGGEVFTRRYRRAWAPA